MGNFNVNFLKGYLDFFKDGEFMSKEVTKSNMLVGMLLIVAAAVIVSLVSNVYAHAFGWGGFDLKNIDYLEMVLDVFKGILFSIIGSVVLAGLVYVAVSIAKVDGNFQETITLSGFIAGYSLVIFVINFLFSLLDLSSSITSIFNVFSSLLPFAIVVSFLQLAKKINTTKAITTGLIVFIVYKLVVCVLGIG